MNYLELVSELNQELYDTHGDTDEQFFFTANGFIDIIGFGEITLWHSENDDREWIENENGGEYEPANTILGYSTVNLLLIFAKVSSSEPRKK